MNNDVKHIGLITKLKAMEGNLLSETDYNNLHNMNNMIEIFNYLHERREYAHAFDSHENYDNLHRTQLEHLLIHSLYDDYFKLYKFANFTQRQFLNIITIRFEINLLKRSLYNLSLPKEKRHLVAFTNFFKYHSHIDYELLNSSDNIKEFAANLKKTRYYRLFQSLLSKEYNKISQYENKLDIFYYTEIWKEKEKQDKSTKSIINELIGSEIDLYNIKTIFRCKAYYNMSPKTIIEYIVPIYYKISKDKINSLIHATDTNTFIKEFNSTYYKKSAISFDVKNIDDSFERVKNKIHLDYLKKNPNSLARVHYFFDKKMYEVHYTTKIIELIRYKQNIYNER